MSYSQSQKKGAGNELHSYGVRLGSEARYHWSWDSKERKRRSYRGGGAGGTGGSEEEEEAEEAAEAWSFGGFMLQNAWWLLKMDLGRRTPKPTYSCLVFPPQNSISHSQTLSGWRRRLSGRGKRSRTLRHVSRKSLQLSLSPLFHLSAEHHPKLLAITQVGFPTFHKRKGKCLL